MKVKFLIQTQEVDGIWTASCSSALEFSFGNTKAEAITGITNNLNQFISTTGKAHVAKFKGHGEAVNCPELTTLLPIDSAYCKISDEPCPIQGQVYVYKEDALKACTASPEAKAGVIRAITSGRYTGFHHVLGRYLCPSCEEKNTNEKRVNFNYHYIFELSMLSSLVDLPEEEWDEIRSRLQRDSKSSAATFSAMCAPCLTDFVGSYIPKMRSALETIELDLYR
jgi:hypothetical protein